MNIVADRAWKFSKWSSLVILATSSLFNIWWRKKGMTFFTQLIALEIEKNINIPENKKLKNYDQYWVITLFADDNNKVSILI